MQLCLCDICETLQIYIVTYYGRPDPKENPADFTVRLYEEGLRLTAAYTLMSSHSYYLMYYIIICWSKDIAELVLLLLVLLYIYLSYILKTRLLAIESFHMFVLVHTVSKT